MCAEVYEVCRETVFEVIVPEIYSTYLLVIKHKNKINVSTGPIRAKRSDHYGKMTPNVINYAVLPKSTSNISVSIRLASYHSIATSVQQEIMISMATNTCFCSCPHDSFF